MVNSCFISAMPLPSKITMKQTLGIILIHPHIFQYVFLNIRTLVKCITIAILQKIIPRVVSVPGLGKEGLANQIRGSGRASLGRWCVSRPAWVDRALEVGRNSQCTGSRQNCTWFLSGLREARWRVGGDRAGT